jgi:DNA-binding transcriptional MerR regulator/DNA-directed RNA polymerase subunit RPC12/RpoP
MYTTGEIAKKCNVSVRTVQYYDEKGILIPSELTEGGRRLFSENDVRTLETICFLKELGISLKDIAAILRSEESKEVITLLLEQRATDLGKEIAEKNEQLSKAKKLKEMLSTFEDSSEKSIHDISKIMEARKNLKQMYVKMLVPGLFMEALEVASLVYGILRGNWIPFAAVMVLVCIYAYIIFRYWHRNIMYICPQCHTTFKPKKSEAFFAGHTAKTRKLTCTECNRKIWCVETFEEAK